MTSKKRKSVAIIVMILLIGFTLGRYGWKIRGFQACQNAGIDNVEVSEQQVNIAGFFPGSFPEGFLGYYAKEVDEKLYVGFKFSALFGIFENGDFNISIPIKHPISEVVVKTRMNEEVIWTKDEGLLSLKNRDGIYLKIEANDLVMVTVSYLDKTIGHNIVLESDEYLYLDGQIISEVKDAQNPVNFIITAKKQDGSVLASNSFLFGTDVEKMFLTVSKEGVVSVDRIE